jgi:hypothetical protein
MRILFICGSLDPGRDGVGDYTRQLASACVELGHSCLLVSICDVVDEASQIGDFQLIRRRDILHASAEQQAALQATITQWQPDWHSLQFVCFAFHPKGFVHALFSFLSVLPDGASRHIMFHELWIRQAPMMPFKLRILGLLQRLQILRAIKRWKPHQCHTSHALYHAILSENQISSKELPLFGNIPIAPPADNGVSTLLSNHKTATSVRIVIVPFSQLDRWEVLEAMTRLHALACSAELTLHIVQVGVDRNGESRWAQIKQFCEQWGWECDQLGPQDTTTVSQLMQVADFGMNSAHIQMCQKSGAVLSMLEHGLPVLCAGINPESRRAIKRPVNASLFSINDDNDTLLRLLKSPPKRAPESGVIAVTQQFISDLAP